MINDIEQNIGGLTYLDHHNLIFTDDSKIWRNKLFLIFRIIFVGVITCVHAIMSPQEKQLISSKVFLAFVICAYINTYKHYERVIRDKKVKNTNVSKQFYYNLLWYNFFPFYVIKLTFVVDIFVGIYLFSHFYNTCGVYDNYIISCATIRLLSCGIVIFYGCKTLLLIFNFLRKNVCNDCGKCYSCDIFNKYLNISRSNLYVAFSGDDELFVSQEADISNECIICFEEEMAGDVWRILPCNHKYHSRCVDPWIENNSSCPNCRATIKN